MLVLALDTSSPATSCALVELESGAVRVLVEELALPPQKAGDLLPDVLAALCARAGRSLDEVSGLAVGLGPGSFTGLRVGLASAKGLAYARRWPLAGCSSLHALALGAARAAAFDRAVLIPALEARRGELFLSAFSIRSTRSADAAGAVGASDAAAPPLLVSLAAERVLQARDVAAWLAQFEQPLLIGPGATKNLEALRAAGVNEAALVHAAESLWPAASAVAELCGPQLLAARFDAKSLFEIAPLYLAQSEPEKALAEGRVGKLPASPE